MRWKPLECFVSSFLSMFSFNALYLKVWIHLSLPALFVLCPTFHKRLCFGVKLTWVWIPTLLLKTIMILGKSFHHSETQLYHLKDCDNNFHLIKLLWRLNEIITLHKLVNVGELPSIMPGERQCVCVCVCMREGTLLTFSLHSYESINPEVYNFTLQLPPSSSLLFWPKLSSSVVCSLCPTLIWINFKALMLIPIFSWLSLHV